MEDEIDESKNENHQGIQPPFIFRGRNLGEGKWCILCIRATTPTAFSASRQADRNVQKIKDKFVCSIYACPSAFPPKNAITLLSSKTSTPSLCKLSCQCSLNFSSNGPNNIIATIANTTLPYGHSTPRCQPSQISWGNPQLKQLTNFGYLIKLRTRINQVSPNLYAPYTPDLLLLLPKTQ